MCGILGTNFNITKNKFYKSLQTLYHRGPDNLEYKKIDNFLLGHTRLSIIDLSKEANQPMTIDNFTIIYNGEIYNYRELITKYNIKCNTNSDTEALLRLYILKKEKILDELDGMFAFGIYDKTKKSLFLARDSIGEKPLYYLFDKGQIIFSSSIQAIKSLYNKELTLNKQAIWDYFTYLWIPEPDTIYNQIKVLKPSCYLILKSNYFEIKKFNYNYKKISNNLIQNTKKIVEKSIINRTKSDVKVGAFLSGGLDSSIVTILASKQITDLDVFTIGFKDNIEPYTGFADETEFAKIVTKNLNVNHHIIKVDENYFKNLLKSYINAIDQPFAVSSALGILAMSKYAKKLGIKVLLSGDGADETFGGYSWYPKLKYNNIVFTKDKPKGWHYYATESEKELFLNNFSLKNYKPSTRLLIQNYNDPKDFINHDKSFYLTNEMMTKLDRMTMKYSIEGRAIFVAPEILKFTDNISYKVLLKRGLKWLLKEAFKDILPKEIVDRKKHGFNAPLKYWFEHSWIELLEQVFSIKSKLNELGILNKSSKENFFKLKDDKRFGDIAFALIILNMWMEKNL